MDTKSLEHHCGVVKVREELDKISRKLALVKNKTSFKNSSHYDNSNSNKTHGVSLPDEREHFDRTVRKRAMKVLKEREREFAREIKREYKPYLEADVQTIKDFPETIGSPKTKKQLIKSK